MMSNMKKTLLLLYLFLSGFVQGQNSEDPSPEDPIPHQVQIRFYTWPLKGILHDQMDIPALPSVYLPSPTGPKQVVLARGSMSAPIDYSGETPPILYTAEKLEPDPETGAQRWKTDPIIKPNIPSSWKRCVVVLFPDTIRADSTWNTLPLETTELSLPKGGSRFLNTSRQQLIVEVDGKRSPLEPGKSFVEKLGNGNDRMRVRIYGRHQVKNRVELIYTASHWRKEEAGNLYVIYPASASRLKILQLSPEEIEKSEEAVNASN